MACSNQDTSAGPSVARSQTMLSVQGVCASYNKKPVLRGVSIEVACGEIVALIGPNGAGKSTVLKVVSGLVCQDSGTVLLGGRVLDHLPVHLRVRHGVGYFLQGGQVFADLTVAENLTMGWAAARDRERAKGFALELFPTLADRIRMRAGLLSGGQKQQLALAMVLGQKPSLLLLDEPSAGMTPAVADELLQKVAAAVDQLGISALVVEQRVAQALQVAHRVYGLKNGEIALHSRPDELRGSELLHHLFIN